MNKLINLIYLTIPLIFLYSCKGIYKDKYIFFDNTICNGEVNKILIEKFKNKMILIDNTDCIIKEYNVVTGENKGPKHCEGDKKTPEGIYKIIEKRDSIYHRFLALDYPRDKDLKKAEELGCYAGDSIGIHSWIEGYPVEGSLGCIRVQTKEEILEIDSLVNVGTEVEIIE